MKTIQSIYNDYQRRNKERLVEDDYQKYAEQFSEIAAGSHNLTKQEAHQIATFMYECPMDRIIIEVLWEGLQKNLENLTMIHPFIDKFMICVAMGKRDTTLVVPAIEDIKPVEERLVERTLTDIFDQLTIDTIESCFRELMVFLENNTNNVSISKETAKRMASLVNMCPADERLKFWEALYGNLECNQKILEAIDPLM